MKLSTQNTKIRWGRTCIRIYFYLLISIWPAKKKKSGLMFFTTDNVKCAHNGKMATSNSNCHCCTRQFKEVKWKQRHGWSPGETERGSSANRVGVSSTHLASMAAFKQPTLLFRTRQCLSCWMEVRRLFGGREKSVEEGLFMFKALWDRERCAYIWCQFGVLFFPWCLSVCTKSNH